MATPLQTPQTDLALKRYDVLFRYLAYENTVYWSRSQFFLVANAGMFAFAAAKLPTSTQGLSCNIWEFSLPQVWLESC